MYYRPETGEIFTTHSDIRSTMTFVIFESVITADALAYNGVFPLEYSRPEVEAGKIAIPFAVELIDDVWTQLWTVRDMTEEELDSLKPIVPHVVTRRQARQALLIRGLLDLVEPAIDAIENPLQRDLAQIEWEDATEFERSRPIVIQIGLALGLDEDGLDELFIFASTL